MGRGGGWGGGRGIYVNIQNNSSTVLFFLVFSFSCCLANEFTSLSLTTANLAAAIILNNKQTKFIQQSLNSGNRDVVA